jgi:hypothetical protein
VRVIPSFDICLTGLSFFLLGAYSLVDGWVIGRGLLILDLSFVGIRDVL